MKTCSYCKQTKPKREFGKCKKHRDGLQSRCKECKRETRRKHYEANRDKYIDKAREYKNQRTKRVAELKSEAGCKFCPERESCALDFHHCQGEKEHNISKLARDGAWEEVKKEMKKCVVVCRNCHAKLHAGILQM